MIRANRKFNVIIPTRERADTFEWCLKTCINQDYDNLNIIVSDNYSSDHTKDIVRSVNDPRVKYFNTGKRVSMSDNWEFALSKVEDGYVMFLGDDDGLMPNIFNDINDIFELHKLPSLTWAYNTYYWPGYALSNHANKLTISFKEKIEILSAKQVLQSVLNFSSHWDKLPFLYNFGIVDYSLIQLGRSFSGRFFNSRIPDVYSSLLLGHLCDNFVFSHKPFSVVGISSHSTGISQSGISGNVQGLNPAKKFETENNLDFHELIPYVHTAAILVAESYNQIKDRVPDFAYEISLQKVVRESLKEAVGFSKLKYEEVVTALKELGTRNHMLEVVEREIAMFSNKAKELNTPVVFGFHITGTGAILNGNDFGIRNIYDATLLSAFARTLNKLKPNSWFRMLLNAWATIKKRWMIRFYYS